MLTNTTFRTIILALAATTLIACESGPSKKELEEANRKAAQEAAEQEERDRLRKEREAAERKARAEAARKEEMLRAQQMRDKMKKDVEANNTVYFEFDRSNIKSEYLPILRKQAQYLVQNSNQRVVIEGFTDQRGTPEYNLALGERRAQAVENFLLNEGVRRSQISVVSYGEEKPAVSGTSEYAMAQNRRAKVVYK